MEENDNIKLSKEEVNNLIGYKIRSIRKSKKMSIERVALDAEMEYTQLSRIERGKINTSIYHIYKISNTLDIRLPDLLDNI